MKTPIYALAAVGILACGGPSYVYTPERPNAVAAGLPASRTPIPQERPEGAVEVASYGITQLQQGDARIPALHVRMVVTNDGDDTPWRLDTRQQLVDIPGEGRTPPMYVNGDVSTIPTVVIPRRERRVLDLYYPLPATVRDDAHLPQFELLWQVQTTARTVASRTAFNREAEEPEPSPYPYTEYAYGPTWPLWAGYGPYWWYDPFYPSGVFIHSRPIAIHDRRAPVRVGRFGGRFHAGGVRMAHGGRR